MTFLRSFLRFADVLTLSINTCSAIHFLSSMFLSVNKLKTISRPPYHPINRENSESRSRRRVFLFF